jgi:hypothetical protein
MKSAFIFALILVILLPIQDSLASRRGVLTADTPIYLGPSVKQKIVGKASAGSAIDASNYPTEGFFKVRLPNGTLGWIQGDNLKLDPPPADLQEDSPPVTVSPGGIQAAPQVSSPQSSQSKPVKRAKGFDPISVMFRAFGGYDFYNVGDLNNLVGATVLSGGASFGGEVDIGIDPDFSILIRAENFTKGVYGLNTVTSPATTILFNMSSIPVMAGVEYWVVQDRSYRFGLGAMIGATISNSITSTSEPNPLATPAITTSDTSTLSGIAFASLIRADAHVVLAHGFTLFGEVGYRLYLAPQAITSSTDLTSGSVFMTNGHAAPISIDLSGAELQAGFSFYF